MGVSSGFQRGKEEETIPVNKKRIEGKPG